jgi:WD40-like Beta Propeller Repeat
MVMRFDLHCRFALIGALVLESTAMVGASDKMMIESVRAMERQLGLKIMRYSDIAGSVRPTQQPLDTYFGQIEVAPDGTAIALWLKTVPGLDERIPILTVKSLKEGEQQVRVQGLIVASARVFGISSGAEVIVVRALQYPIQRTSRWKLLAIDRRSGVVAQDLTPFVSQLDLENNFESENYLEDVSVSGPGTLVALGTPQQMQVLEIPSGKTIYAGPGRFPRLSPDGKRLAFVNKEMICIHSFGDGSTRRLLKGKRVKGVGGWSPDGRFLLAGAWTRPKLLAWEKRQVIVDTTTGEYSVIGTLGEGDYGTHFGWVSVKLLER